MNRRDFLRTTGAAVGAAAISSEWYSGRSVERELTVISKQPGHYHGWPTLARRSNGHLVVVYSGGRERHVCPFGRVEYMTSIDDGKTWTWPRVLLDGPIDDRDAGALETSDGTLLVTSFSSLAYEPTLTAAEKNPAAWPEQRLARWRSAHARAEASQRKSALGVWMTRSTDGGLSWSGRYDTIVNSPHGPIQLSDGRLLYAGKRLWTDKRVGVCISKDDGESWEWHAEIPTRAGDHFKDYHELHAVETKSGRIVVQIRNHNRANHRETLQCHSTDGGLTWSKPEAIGVWGLPSHLLRLNDDRLLMSYGHRRKPFGNLARLSVDEGRRWSRSMTIAADGTSGDLGYPSTVQIADGSLLSVWYEKVAGSSFAVLRQSRWQIL